MTKQKFHIVMNALDNELLEEAKQPTTKSPNFFRWVALAAACFFLIFSLSMNFQQSTITAAELIEQGYDIYLPESAQNVTYHLNKKAQPEIAQATFTLNGENYTYEVTKSPSPMFSATENANNQFFSWTSNGLDLFMEETNTHKSVCWYSTAYNTQHVIYSSIDAEKLMCTTREVLLLTGLDLANAPSGAENIAYNVFPYENLVIAETTFYYNNTLCSYRMAATIEVDENYTDISGLNNSFQITVPGNVSYCLAKLSYTPDKQGKIIWFDVVPGILYSFTMDDNASEDTLLLLANEIFKPAQADAE